MNELLELKHRIDNCTDDLQSFELERFMTNSLLIYGNLKKLLCQKCSLWLSLSSNRGRGVRPN